MLDTPVLFLVFNRPDLTRQVFARIREVQPKKLFIAADGPRRNHAQDATKCLEVREIVQRIDWDCEVSTLFREENLGCAKAVSNAITWFFEGVEEGIILEDDCLPDESFFFFCKEVLSHYSENEEVMMISGNNFQFGKKRGKASYYFSHQAHIWGWATWKRAWSKFTYDLEGLCEFIAEKKVDNFVSSKREQNRWINIFLQLKKNEINSWAYRWQYSIWKDGGVTILPNYNLVSNVGFGGEATQTKNKKDIVSNLKINSIDEIFHPNKIKPNFKADRYTIRYLYRHRNSFINRVRTVVYAYVPANIIYIIKKVKSITK
uniref:Nucleotide-diphospho-sugar transferase n=1 Tax=Roseihalotalea indica TaxID=2867963 RepID=A0AA49GND3_9BACT|nr:nucleotide-diphospho-sugar transferase [Tunicatimonas sp. TK19036]